MYVDNVTDHEHYVTDHVTDHEHVSNSNHYVPTHKHYNDALQ